MKSLLKKGYISITMIIIATILIAIGLVGVTAMSANGKILMDQTVNALDSLGLFGNGKMTYDENGYGKELHINPADINPVDDFTLEWSDTYNGWMITGYNNYSDTTPVIPMKNTDDKFIVGIADSVFYWCDLTSVAIPNSIIYIGESAFEQNYLTSVVIPDSVTIMGRWAFFNNQLVDLYMPGTIDSVGQQAFNDNQLPEKLAYIYSNGYSKDKLVSYGGVATSVVVPAKTKIIGQNVFAGKNISSVSLPSGLVEIQSMAFSGTNLVSVVVPSTVTVLGDSAFGSTPLMAVHFLGVVPTTLGSNIFLDNYDLVDNTVAVPALSLDNYKNNADYFAVAPSVFCSSSDPTCGVVPTNPAFNAGWYDASLNIKNQDVNSNADFTYEKMYDNDGKFYAYKITDYINASDTSVVVPAYHNGKPIIAIGDFAFNYKFLVSAALPNTIQDIGRESFCDNALTSIIIPTSTLKIGMGAFSYNQISSVKMPTTVEVIESIAFQSNNMPLNKAFFYSSGSDTETIVSFGGNLDTEYAVVIPNGVTTIGQRAFYMVKMSSISIPNTVVNILNGAFENATIPSVVIPNSVTYFDTNVFSGIKANSITLSSNTPSITDFMFTGASITSLVIPNSVTSIGRQAFYSSQITSIEIPASVTYLNSWAFAQCRNLTSVKFLGNLPGMDAPYNNGYWTTYPEIFSWDSRLGPSPLGVGSIKVPAAQLAAYRAQALSFALPTTSFVGY